MQDKGKGSRLNEKMPTGSNCVSFIMYVNPAKALENQGL